MFKQMSGQLSGSASDYDADGWGFAPQTGHPFIGSPSLNGYWSLTRNLTATEKGTGHPTPPCCWTRIMGAATCPSATLTYHANSVQDLGV